MMLFSFHFQDVSCMPLQMQINLPTLLMALFITRPVPLIRCTNLNSVAATEISMEKWLRFHRF